MKKIMLLLLAALLWTTAANAQTGTVVVAEGTTTNEYVPVYGYYADAVLRCQTIYPATMMAGLTGAEIQGLVYYMTSPVSTDSGGDIDGTFEVKIGTCTASAFADDADEFDASTLTTVYTGTLDLTSSAQVTITFATPYTYTGGNLMIEVSQTVESNDYGTTSFYGISSTGASLQSYEGWSGPEISVQDFIPKTGFIVPVSCGVPTIGSIATTETSATISWTEDVASSSWSFRLNDGDWQTITTNPYTVSGLTANTAYTFALRAICGAGDTSFAVSGSFRTTCGIQSVPYTEDFTGYTTYQTPDCWTAVQTYTSGSSTYPCVTSGGHEGNGLYLYGFDETNFTIIASPQLDRTVNSCYLAFDAKVGNYESAVFYPGIITNPADPTSFVAIDTIIGNQNNASSWTTYEYNLSTIAAIASSTSRYIAFKMDGDRDGVNIDNISITLPPSCDHPTIGTANASAEQAIISWTEAGSATQWSFRLNDGAWQTVTTNPYTVTGLTANTAYTYEVRSICGAGDTSTAVSGSFRTPCATEAFPYSEGFESYDANTFPSCWTSVSGSSTVVSAHASEGTKSLKISGIGTVVSPIINIAGSNALVTFDLECESLSYSGDMAIGVAMSPATIDATIWIDTIHPAEEDVQLPYEYTYINTMNIQNGCIVFKQVNTTSSSWYYWLDNLVITTPPSCSHPTINNVNATATDATLSWNEIGSATQWSLRLNDGAWQTVTTNPYTVTGLTANTDYTYELRSICGAGDTSTAVSGSFRTPCTSIATADLPFYESFEGNDLGCWQNEIIAGSNSWTLTEAAGSSSSAINPVSGNQLVLAKATTKNQEARLISPVFNVAGAENLTLFFHHTQLAWAGDQDSLAVEYRLDGGNAWQRLAIYTENISSWTEETIPLPATSATLQIAFHAYMQYGYGITLDSVTLKTVSCANPVITDITAGETTATVTWTGSASQYGVRLGNGAEEIVNTTSKTFSDLASSASYTVYIRSICGAGDTSDVVSQSFRTQCGIISEAALPYFEGFEGGIDCWEQETISGTTSWITGSSVGYSYAGISPIEGNNAASIYGNSGEVRLISPVFNVNGVENLTLKFAHVQRSWSGDQDSIAVEYRTSSSDEWHRITGYTSEVYDWTVQTVPLTTTSSTLQFAFHAYLSMGYGIGIDSLKVLTVACAEPIITSATSTDNSITVNWTGTASQYGVRLDNGEEEVVNGTTKTFTGLNNSTQYTVYLRSICGTDYSETVSRAVRTQCGAIATADLPFFEGFESDDFGCWEQEIISGSDEWMIDDYQFDPVEGSTYAYAASYQGEVRLISPIFNLEGASNVVLRFLHAQQSDLDYGDYYDTMAVEYRLSPTDQWHRLDGYSNEILTFESAEYTIPEVSATVQFAFHAYLNYGYGLAVDSVSLTAEAGVACATPTNVTATNATEGSVVVSWNGSASQYEIEVTNTAAGTTTTYTATASPYTVAGLSSETAYSVKVRALCEGGETSSWSSSVSFSTTAPAPCNTPTGLSVTNRAGNNITIAWEGTAAQYEIEATNTRNNTVTNYTTTETTYMITGLSSGTTYSIRVRAICSANNTSEWTAPVEGTTAGQNGISDVEAANAIRIYPNPTSVSTTINIEGVNGVVKIDIVDMNGRIIKSETTGCNNGCTKQIEVADMAKGAYFVRVSNDKLNVVRKLIVK